MYPNAPKIYSNEHVYKMVLVSLQHPEAGLLGDSFWGAMINRYGFEFFGRRDAGAVRFKWRKIAIKHEHDMMQYTEKLEKSLGEAKVESIKKEMSLAVLAEKEKEREKEMRKKAGLGRATLDNFSEKDVLVNGEGIQLQVDELRRALDEKRKVQPKDEEKHNEDLIHMVKEMKNVKLLINTSIAFRREARRRKEA